MHSKAFLFLFCLVGLISANDDAYYQAKLRARLAKAKSTRDVLFIFKTSPRKKGGPLEMISEQGLKKEAAELEAEAADKLREYSGKVVETRHGGCEPRVICEEVPIEAAKRHNTVAAPLCVEIHRCGGCCQDRQYPCVPIQEEPVIFSPVIFISFNSTNEWKEIETLKLMNHTKCECKCGITEEQCREKGKSLDADICQCIDLRCTPECHQSSTCSTIPGFDKPRCSCRRRVQGSRNYCVGSNQRPDQKCSRCETV